MRAVRGALAKRNAPAGWRSGIGELRFADSPYGLDEYANLVAYVARGEARPAYHRAFKAQWEVWESGVR